MGNGVAEYKGEKVAPGFEHSVSPKSDMEITFKAHILDGFIYYENSFK
jgi:hypothetical protein